MKFDRAEAIDWIMNQVWREGVEALSVNAASAELGITRSSFYNAFGSKEAAVLEAIDHYASISPYAKLVKLAGSSQPLVHLTQVVLDMCDFLSGDDEHKGCMAMNCSSELIGRHDELGPILERMNQSSFTAIEGLLARAVELGELPESTNTQILARQVQTFICGLATLSKMHHEKGELKQATTGMLQALGVYREG